MMPESKIPRPGTRTVFNNPTSKICLLDKLERIAFLMGKRNAPHAAIIRKAKTLLLHQNSALCGLLAYGTTEEHLPEYQKAAYNEHKKNANRAIKEFGELV